MNAPYSEMSCKEYLTVFTHVSHVTRYNVNSFAIIGGAEFRLVSNAFSNSRIKSVFGFRAVHSMADPRDEEANNNFILFHVGFIYSL